MFTEKIEQQRKLMKQALKCLDEIETYERMLRSVDPEYVDEQRQDLSVEYGIKMTLLVKTVVEQTGFELIERNKSMVAIAEEKYN